MEDHRGSGSASPASTSGRGAPPLGGGKPWPAARGDLAAGHSLARRPVTGRWRGAHSSRIRPDQSGSEGPGGGQAEDEAYAGRVR